MGHWRLNFGGVLPTLALIFWLSISSFSSSQAQQPYTLGAMQNVPQLNVLNPAITPDSKWYIGIPLLSGIGGQYRNSSFNLQQFGFGTDTRADFFTAMNFADTLNFARAEAYVEGLSIGVNLGKHYLSFRMADRVQASMQYPLDLIRWLGYEQEGVDIPLGRVFNLDQWNFSAQHYREFSLGLARKMLDDRFTVAVRAKALVGQSAIQSENYNLRLWYRPEEDYNYEITGRMEVLAAGFGRFSEGASPFSLAGNANLGIAFDVGLQFQPNDKVNLYASITDFGQLDWNKHNTISYITDIAQEGAELFDRTTDDLAYDRERGARNFSTQLTSNVYAGGQFLIGRNHSFSFLGNARMYPDSTVIGGSVAYRLRTSKFLDLIGSINLDEYQQTNLGFGATINLNPVQIYVATDKVTSVLNRNTSKDFQLVAGINLLFGQTKEPIPVAQIEEEQLQEDMLGVAETVPDAPSRPQPAPEELTTKDADEERYFTFYGTVFDDETGEALEAVYVDVFKVLPDGERELIHTSRYPGHTFNVPLFQNGEQHEISVGGYGYSRQVIPFRADRPHLEQEFRLQEGLWTNEELTAEVIEEEILPPPAVDAREMLADFGSANAAVVRVLLPSNIRPTYEIVQRTSLRSNPDPQARVMKRLAIGTVVAVLEKTNNDWWKVELDGQIGYVKRRLLSGVQ